jgi:regulator of nucleoside diphosphate kinase
MSKNNFILTTKDFTILEVMRDHPLGRHDRLLELIRRKMCKAIVVFREDLPDGVASINSRVTFRVNDGENDTRVLSTGQVTAPVGMFLPITTLRGLALLGLSEGQDIVLTNLDGVEERVLLEKVDYQPEASRRERQALGVEVAPNQNKPLLRVVSSGVRQMRHPVSVNPTGHDDPGPSAA